MGGLEALAAALPDGALLTDADLLAGYRQDWAKDPDAGWPVAVVRATSTADVQAAVRWAASHRVPVVPRGAGTGLSGGALPVDLPAGRTPSLLWETALASGEQIRSLRPRQSTLEEVFLAVLSESA